MKCVRYLAALLGEHNTSIGVGGGYLNCFSDACMNIGNKVTDQHAPINVNQKHRIKPKHTPMSINNCQHFRGPTQNIKNRKFNYLREKKPIQKEQHQKGLICNNKLLGFPIVHQSFPIVTYCVPIGFPIMSLHYAIKTNQFCNLIIRNKHFLS